MARQVNRLNARRVQALTKPGRYADGGGLCLVVAKGGSRKWTFYYRRHRDGRLREIARLAREGAGEGEQAARPRRRWGGPA